MATIDRFEDIKAWQKARILTEEIYGITKTEEFSKDFGLKNQIRKASVSIMSNIAEGFERDGNAEFQQFLSISKGSCGEVQSQLYVAENLSYINKNKFTDLYNLAEETKKCIGGFINFLRNSESRGLKFKKE